MGYTVIKDGKRPCIVCKSVLPLELFGSTSYTTKQGKPSRRFAPRCKPCEAARRAERYARNRPVERAMNAAWIEANKDAVRERRAKAQQTKELRARKAAAQRERKQRMKAGGGHKDPLVAYVYQQARLLEEKLRACVACDDDLELQVHVDHVIPLSKGGRHELTNLMVVSGKENLRKGVRVG